MKRSVVYYSAFGLLLFLVAFMAFWFFYWRFIEYTSDAYVNGNQVIVTSQINGYIKAVYFEDTSLVKQGDLLVELDLIDNTIAFEKAKEELAETVRNFIEKKEKVAALKAEKELRNAVYVRTGLDYAHREELLSSGAVSLEDYQHAEAAFAEAYAATLVAEHNLRMARAEIEDTTLETHPLVIHAKESLRQAYVNLKRCKIYAPVSGMAARKAAQVGEAISPADALLTIVPFDQIWVDANFKETQLHHMRVGLPVHLRSDIYGGSVHFHGKVIGIAAGTGSIFSVLPPQNATGNWIKIVQRLPVRIMLDPSEMENYPLRLGLSMEATIDVRAPIEEIDHTVAFETDIFDQQQAGVEELINKIIYENSSWNQNL